MEDWDATSVAFVEVAPPDGGGEHVALTVLALATHKSKRTAWYDKWLPSGAGESGWSSLKRFDSTSPVMGTRKYFDGGNDGVLL
jgi:hypothetical protein